MSKDRTFQMGLNIISLGISVTYQHLKINKYLFILNCLLVQLFCALNRNELCFKPLMTKSLGLNDCN